MESLPAPRGQEMGIPAFPEIGRLGFQADSLPRGGVIKRQAAAVEGNAIRKREPRAIRPVSDDRAASARELGPQLVAPARRGLKFHQRHLAGPAGDPAPHVGGLLWACIVLGTRRRPGEEVMPVDPLPKRRRKSAGADGDIRLLN